MVWRSLMTAVFGSALVLSCCHVGLAQEGGPGGSEVVPINDDPVNPAGENPNRPDPINPTLCFTTANKQCSDFVAPIAQVTCSDLLRQCRKRLEGGEEIWECGVYPIDQDSYEKQIRTDIEVPWVSEPSSGGWHVDEADVTYCVVGFGCECAGFLHGGSCRRDDDSGPISYEFPVQGWVIDLGDSCSGGPGSL